MRERDLIARIAAGFAGQLLDGARGFVDDGARLPAVPEGNTRVVTTDAVVEGVDFRLDWGGPESAGHRALLQNLSDLSAMGARPVAFTWALALPRDWLDDAGRLDGFVRGAAALAAREGILLAGGDLSSTDGPFVAAITALGDVSGPPLGRAGARAGDGLFVAGPLGASRVGLRALIDARDDARARRAHLWHADVDLTFGRRLVGRARAAMDLSDGLGPDLARLCRASGVGARLTSLVDACAHTDAGAVSLDDALTGGEDYHLLFVLAEGDDGADLPSAIRIGTITEDVSIALIHDGETRVIDADDPAFFDHTARASSV